MNHSRNPSKIIPTNLSRDSFERPSRFSKNIVYLILCLPSIPRPRRVVLAVLALAMIYLSRRASDGPPYYCLDQGLQAARFLQGAKLSYQKSPIDASQEVWAILLTISCYPRRASVEQDLVLAIWPYLEYYRTPKSWNELSLGSLLQDAVGQSEKASKRSPVNCLLKGLFCDGAQSGLWRPAEYLSSTSALERSSQDIYGALKFSGSTFSITLGGCIKPKRRHSTSLSRATRSKL